MNVARWREITVFVLSFPTDVKFQLALEIEHPEMKELTDVDYMPNRMRYKRRATMCKLAHMHMQTHMHRHAQTFGHRHTDRQTDIDTQEDLIPNEGGKNANHSNSR